MATTVILQPDATTGIDTLINSFSPGVNYGITTTIGVGVDAGSTGNRRGLIKFDLSSIPVGAIITSAVLSLYHEFELSTTDFNIYAYRALTDWVEGSRNAGTPSAGENGSVYNFRNANGSVAWAGGAGGASGSDWFATASDIKSITAPSQFFNFNVTNDVIGFLNGSLTNYGWWLINATESGGVSSQKAFTSSDGVTAANRPKLTVTYETLGAIYLQPDATDGIDTAIDQAAPTANYGAWSPLPSGRNAPGRFRSLIKFTLPSIPAGAIVTSALLQLRVSIDNAGSPKNYNIYRSLVSFFEGVGLGTTPGAGIDGSTWNLRNHNGSVAWTGGAGGASGVEYTASPTATVSVAGADAFYSFEVKADIQAFLDGVATNNGWWLFGDESGTSNLKQFSSSDSTTIASRPKLTIYYSFPIVASISGTSTVSGVLKGTGHLSALAIGTSSFSSVMYTNGIIASIDGTSTLTARLGSLGRGAAVIAGTSTVIGRIRGKTHLTAVIAGIGSLTANGHFEGQMRVVMTGSGSLTATGAVLARHIARVKGCYADPLFYITDGKLLRNGQLNRLNLIDSQIGFLLSEWKPNIAQYKNGGMFSESFYGTGRRLIKRVFANAIEVLSMKVKGSDQDNIISYARQFFYFQEAAADYWTANWGDTPIYIVAKAPLETNIRYAIIYIMSCPELENTYAQPFYSNRKPAIENFMMRIERGDWTSVPPRESECVAISSARSWTIAGWTGP